MGISVNFKTRAGENTSRIFQKNEGVSIYGKVTGISGVFEPFIYVRCEVKENNVPIFTRDTYADIFGDYDFYFLTPNRDTNLEVNIFSQGINIIQGNETRKIPIAVGNKIPKNIVAEAGSLDLVFYGLVIIGAFLLYNKFQE